MSIDANLKRVLQTGTGSGLYKNCRIYMAEATWSDLRALLEVRKTSLFELPFMFGFDVLIDNDLAYGIFELRRVLDSAKDGEVVTSGRVFDDTNQNL